MNHAEDREQAAVFEWAAYFPVLKWMHSIPNGAHLAGDKNRRAMQMARLKKQGLRPGVLDIFLPLVRPPYPGLYVEMKRGDGKGQLSDKQGEFMEYAQQQGYKCVVCHGAGEAIAAISEYAGIG